MTVVNSRGGDLVTTVWAEFGVATFVLSLRIYTTFQLLERVNPWAKAATLCAVLAWASNRVILAQDAHANMCYRALDC